jgi:hypothetical protein
VSEIIFLGFAFMLSCVAVSFLGFRAWIEVVRLGVTTNKNVAECQAIAEQCRSVTNSNTKELTAQVLGLQKRLGEVEAGNMLRVRR